MDAQETTRFRLTVHYDGSAFHGWQVQPDRRTVQGDVEAAATRLADAATPVIGSGRTDTGVHSTGQVASVDMPSTWDAATLRRSLNALLAGDVWIEAVVVASPDFHPRYDAVSRTYRYEVGTSPMSVSPFKRRWCWPLAGRDATQPVELDRGRLARCADMLVGEHNFEAFAKAGQAERGFRCSVQNAAWSPTDLGTRFTITADRYLHHMVRYLTGTMVDIARARRPEEDLARLLAREPDVVTSPPAPAQGLFLERVEYPGEAATPSGTHRSVVPRSATPA